MKRIWLYVEGWWPWAAAILIAYAWQRMGSPFPMTPDALFGAAATVASVLASFLGVSKAIVLTIKTTKTYEILETKGYTATLFSFLRAGVFCSILFSAASIIGFFVNHDLQFRGMNVFWLFCNVWVFLGAAALLTYIRISNILFKLLHVA